MQLTKQWQTVICLKLKFLSLTSKSRLIEITAIIQQMLQWQVRVHLKKHRKWLPKLLKNIWNLAVLFLKKLKLQARDLWISFYPKSFIRMYLKMYLPAVKTMVKAIMARAKKSLLNLYPQIRRGLCISAMHAAAQ